MLILTRQIGDVITIGDDTELIVLGVKNKKVSIGITAPLDVSVHREEIYKLIQKENAEKARE